MKSLKACHFSVAANSKFFDIIAREVGVPELWESIEALHSTNFVLAQVEHFKRSAIAGNEIDFRDTIVRTVSSLFTVVCASSVSE